MNTRSPNILWIMCDQLRHDCTGFAGHELVQTPNLDTLASQGVVFENAYCASPVCSPARASWLTGLYPHRNGQLDNYSHDLVDEPGRVLHHDCITIGDVLKDHGYRCGIAGPWHLGHDHMPQHGLTDFWCTYSYQGKHPDRLNKYFNQHGINDMYGRGVPDHHEHVQYMRHAAWTDSRQQRTTWTVDRSIEFLEDCDDQPFFLFASIKDPHPVMIVPPDLLNLYPLESIPLDPTWRDPLKGKPRYQFEGKTRVASSVRDRDFLCMMAHYYALITHIDEQVGRLLKYLDQTSRSENTIVVFMSDHGEMLGSHGFVSKRLMYENSVKVPCVIHWPAGLPKNQRIRTPLGGVDLMPTLLNLAGQPVNEKIDGRSVAEAICSKREPTLQPIFSEISYNKACGPENAETAMVLDGNFKYVWHRDDLDELYNLEDDPLEMANLAGHSEQENKIDMMRGTFKDMLQRNGAGPYAWCTQ